MLVYGKFHNRNEIKNVKKLGAKTYTQAIGFLRILDGDLPLDATAIHPENYQQALDLLNPGGRISVITFQSLEDRLVKVMFKQKTSLPELPPGLPVIPDSQKVEYKLITRKPIVPSEDEITHTNRDHSAKLRIIEKL